MGIVIVTVVVTVSVTVVVTVGPMTIGVVSLSCAITTAELAVKRIDTIRSISGVALFTPRTTTS